MSKNNLTLIDQDGDYSDWIELFNNSDQIINLEGWYLSDEIENPHKWQFPDAVIHPKNFLIIRASGENEILLGEIHTNFKIKSEGETITLSDPDGNIQDQFAPVVLDSDISYGRIPDGGIEKVMMTSPTPGTSNISSPPLTFSHNAGYYNAPFQLTIEAEDNDKIYYTRDGSFPTTDDELYNGSLLISESNSLTNTLTNIPNTPTQDLISYRAWQPQNITSTKTNVIRCAAFREGNQVTKVHTKTFFFDFPLESNLPVIALTAEKKDLFDEDQGIYVPGSSWKEDKPEFSGNYFQLGKLWERPVHLEYFNNQGQLEFSQNAGLRIHGGKTRHATQKSLRLYARSEYGKSFFSYPLLPSREVQQYKRILLQTTMGSWENSKTVIQDILAQQISKNLDLEYQEYQPVIVYINGEYWGIHTLRDRLDENYVNYITDVEQDSVLIESWSFEPNIFSEQNDLSLDQNYDSIQQIMDMGNYIDYTIAEQFFGNYDWPANNLKLWKEKPNGKWRWFLYDLDGGFGDVNINMMNHCTNEEDVSWPNPPSSTLLFRSLIKNDLFKERYLDRYAYLLNNVFHPDSTAIIFDQLKAQYEPAMERHIIRWNYPQTVNSWLYSIETNLGDYLKERPCAVRKNLLEYFNLTSFDFECIKNNASNPSLNQLKIGPNPTQGQVYLISSENVSLDKMYVSDVNGKVIFSVSSIFISGSEHYEIPLDQLPSGVYFIHLIQKLNTSTYKIIVQ